LGFKSVFLLSIEWTQTYVYYYFPPVFTAAENNQNQKQNLLQHHIKKKRTEYCLYTYTKLSFLGFWPDSKPIIVTLLHYLYYISCNSFAFKFQSKTYLVYITYIQNFLCLILHNPRLNIFDPSFSTQETRRKNKEKLSQIQVKSQSTSLRKKNLVHKETYVETVIEFSSKYFPKL